jgi:hypothetical protein
MQQGAVSEALLIARDTVALADQTDSPDLRASAMVDLGAVLRSSNRPAAARRALRSAIALYDQKGNTASADEARSIFEQC